MCGATPPVVTPCNKEAWTQIENFGPWLELQFYLTVYLYTCNWKLPDGCLHETEVQLLT